DIGCYTLAIAPPFEMADCNLSMGSSTGTGCGFARATEQKVIGFIGDSTFFHAGIPGLINAVHNRDKMMLVILDNRTTAATGGQPNPGMSLDGMGGTAPEVSIEEIVKAAGVGFIKTVDPFNLKRAEETFTEALQYDGIAVVIAKHPCAAMITDRERRRKGIHITFNINPDKCNRCMVCVREFACPAICVAQDGSINIDPTLCDGCGVCRQVCLEKAIEVRK
ncbi:unnamed protein product, partial [marine sediment metagenome]